MLPSRQFLMFPQDADLQEAYHRSLEADLASIQSAGCASIVSLVEDNELPLDGIHGYYEQAEAIGLRVLRFPTVDGDAPSLDTLRMIVAQILEELRQGHSVLVHCRAGWGRTGTVAAACLVAARGLSPKKAVAMVRHVRSPHCVETQRQYDALKRFAQRDKRVECMKSCSIQ